MSPPQCSSQGAGPGVSEVKSLGDTGRGSPAIRAQSSQQRVWKTVPYPGAMDAVELARKLQEEAICAICLDYFTDPVMTTCGHFCRKLWLTWERAKGRKGSRKCRGSFPCPECRKLSP